MDWIELNKGLAIDVAESRRAGEENSSVVDDRVDRVRGRVNGSFIGFDIDAWRTFRQRPRLSTPAEIISTKL